MPRTCKICGDKCWILIDYLRLRKAYTYSQLIEAFGWRIDNLNKANLSNHFKKHIYGDEVEMLKEMEKEEPFPLGILEFMHEFREKWLGKNTCPFKHSKCGHFQCFHVDNVESVDFLQGSDQTSLSHSCCVSRSCAFSTSFFLYKLGPCSCQL